MHQCCLSAFSSVSTTWLQFGTLKFFQSSITLQKFIFLIQSDPKLGNNLSSIKWINSNTRSPVYIRWVQYNALSSFKFYIRTVIRLRTGSTVNLKKRNRQGDVYGIIRNCFSNKTQRTKIITGWSQMATKGSLEWDCPWKEQSGASLCPTPRALQPQKWLFWCGWLLQRGSDPTSLTLVVQMAIVALPWEENLTLKGYL